MPETQNTPNSKDDLLNIFQNNEQNRMQMERSDETTNDNNDIISDTNDHNGNDADEQFNIDNVWNSHEDKIPVSSKSECPPDYCCKLFLVYILISLLFR